MRFGGFGARYAAALTVDAVGAGLLRPFLVLYGVSVLGLSPSATGLALSAGLLAGLAAVPLVGRWIDADRGTGPFAVPRSGRRTRAGTRKGPVAVARSRRWTRAGTRSGLVAATLLVRVAGVAVLLAAHGVWAFVVAAVLLGVGNQAWPPAHAALVAALADGPADAPLAFGRSLRNAGLGVGALVAAVAVGGGPGVLRVLAAGTAAGYLIASVLVLSMRTAQAPARARVTSGGPNRLRVLAWANLPLALCFAVLEVVLPVVLTERLHAGAAWSGLIFAGNTVLVVAFQVPLVVRLAGRSRRGVLAASGVVLAASYAGFWAAPTAWIIAAVGVVYTVGEMLYAGSGTALVTAAARPGELGRALSGWQLSTGVANALAPALLLPLLDAGNAPLWITLIGGTLAGALIVGRWGPVTAPERTGPDGPDLTNRENQVSGCAAGGGAAAAETAPGPAPAAAVAAAGP